MIEIRLATYDEVVRLKGKDAPRCGFHYHPDTVYVGAFDGDEIIACVGYRVMNSIVEYESDVTKKEYRKKGIYTKLYSIRERMASLLPHKKRIAFCTEYSIGKYLAQGFEIKKKYKSTYKVEKIV